MKKRRICVAAAVICLLLSGCTSLSLNSPDILTPPKAEGSQAEIQELIKKSAGKSFEMVYPERGDYQSSVIFVNLDDDDDDEAIAMYTREKETVDLLVADKKNNNYTLLTEGTIHAPKIDRVELADFGGKTKEIVISYPGSSATLQSLTFLSVNGEDQDDMINSCAAHVIGDFNGDKIDDLMTLSPGDGENLPTARLYIGADGTREEQSSCEVASNIKEYVNLSFGKICDEMSGAVVDAVDNNGTYSTQIICYDYNQRSVINPLYVSDGFEKTKRTAAIRSADIDRDGIIEIPLCEPTDFSSNEDEGSVCDRIDWSSYEYTQADFSDKQSAILCEKLGFILNLTPEHADIVTARYTGENTMSVYLWEYKRNAAERTTKLLTVKRYKKEGFDNDAVLEAVAAENNNYIYTYIIETEDDYYRYTDDEVKDNIVLIEEPSDDAPLK